MITRNKLNKCMYYDICAHKNSNECPNIITGCLKFDIEEDKDGKTV